MSGGRVVACLCAEWCGVCREFRPVFERAAAAQAGVRFHWVDIEDEAELMGEVDVETFPTLLIVEAGQARFFGPVLPKADAVASAMRAATGAVVADAELQGLAARLEARHPHPNPLPQAGEGATPED